MKMGSTKTELLMTMAISKDQLELLETRCNVTQAGWGLTGYRLNEDEFCSLIQHTEILLAGYEHITTRVIQAAACLKLIAISRANPVNVDLSTVNARGIPVIYTPGRNAIAAAEFTMGMILDQARHISRGDRTLRSGKYLGEPAADLFNENPINDVVWNLDGDSPYTRLRGIELNGRTLGLIGLGNVASRLTRLAQAFGMRVITHTPERDAQRANELGIKIVDLHQLLSTSDFISVNCAVTPETKAILDEKAFAVINPSAYIINTARASIIDQAALVRALQEGRIAGAALDVYWYEPLPANHPLLNMENVTLTPHLAGSTHEVPERHSRMIVKDVLAWLDGERPMNIFNPEIYQK